MDGDKLAEPTGLPNVNMISIAELFAEDDSVLANAVKRLARKVSEPQDALAAFTSYVE